MALVELGVAAVADELGQSGISLHGNPEELLEVGAEERIDAARLVLQLRKRLPQPPRGELPMTQSTEARAHPACERTERSKVSVIKPDTADADFQLHELVLLEVKYQLEIKLTK